MFLVVGECLVDLISEPGSWRFEAAPGGSPLNVAAGLATAGHQVRLASEVGDDLFGRLVREHLHRYGVGTADLVATEGTGLAFAQLDPDGGARYDFRFSWTWSATPDLNGVDCLHVGSLAAVTAPGAESVRAVVRAARSRGVTVSYDPNVRPPLMRSPAAVVEEVEELVALADIVKVSSEDLVWLYPGEPDLVAAARWAGPGPGRGPWLTVVTRGRRGAVALRNGYAVGCAPPAVTVIDTVGAGDAFTAGLLASLASAGQLADPAPDAVDEALRQATATAAAVCAHRGAAPADPASVRSLAARVGALRRSLPPA
jgi:fructokinase